MSDLLGIGIIGAGWITRAHGLAIRTLPHLEPLGRPVRITMLAARGRERGEAMARHLEVDRFTTDWREVVEDPAVHIVANLTAVTGHREATEAALALGKPVLCEKPLGVDRFEAGAMAAAAATAGVQAATGFNYRYVPAMRLAREIVRSGALGTIVQFRATYLQDYAAVASALQPPNGSRAVSDYAHIVDFLRYLGCAAEAVQATTAKLTATGPDVEDAYVAAVDLVGGGIASLEASRVARGWKGRQVVEVNGTTGALWWNMEDMNRLHVFYGADEAEGTGGFRDVLVTQPDHPSLASWWPPGHTVGWEHGFIHEWHDLVAAVIAGGPLPPHQATFEDGYEAALICDAILTSAHEGRRVAMDEMRSAAPAAATRAAT
jgi:predicted dehydrogenase